MLAGRDAEPPDQVGRRITWSGGLLPPPHGGTRLLGTGGAPVLWLTCAFLALVAVAAQLALAPAIRRRRAAALDAHFSSE
jgi:hypothetical protein